MIPKFRAWLKETKTMHEVTSIDFHNESVNVKDNPIGMPFHHYDEDGNAILMQSTGLHDKNGVEIFEDDVVKNGGEYWHCIFKVTSFKLVRRKYKTADDGTRYFDFYSPTQYTSYKEFSQCEVVGNIYENPELLEQ